MNWWDSTPPVELTIHCSGSRHRLVWNKGAVSLIDHPDIEAELALVALGGEEPPCLGHRNLWDDAVADGGFLAEWVDETHLTPARLSWLSMALDRMASEGFHEFLRDLPLRRAERMGQFLYGFPRPWLDRAAGAVSAAVVDGDGVACANATGLLSSATAARLRRCFVSAVAGTHLTVGTAALVPLAITVDDSTAPRIAGRLRGPDRGVSITVAPGWLHRVWAAGLGVVDGYLILDVGSETDSSPPGTASTPAGSTARTATAIEWDPDDPGVTPTLSRRSAAHVDGAWRLGPEPDRRVADGRPHRRR